MSGQPLDLDALIGKWRSALDAAQGALRAGSRDLPRPEVTARTQRLASERAATMHQLEAFARDRRQKPLLARLVASSSDTKRLLGLPPDVRACVFNVDGVLVGSAAIHAEAWKEAFDRFVSRRIERSGHVADPFSIEVDYPRHIHGKSRVEAVREFLASRGIALPEGLPGDLPDADTVHGLANRKKLALLRLLDERGVSAYEGSRLYLELAHDARVPCAVVSGSTNAHTLLDRARLTAFIDDVVDGNTQRAEHLRRKPAPDMLLAACRHLGVEPERTAVFETTADGVDAGRAGGFELVVAVDQRGESASLRAQGADLVVADLGEILEHELAA